MKSKIANLLLLLTVMFSASVLLNSCGVKDADVEKAVAEKISATPELSGISATVKDGVVTLSGEVKDDASKAMAETSVKGIKGVKSVVNNTSVAPPPPPPATVEITADDPLTKAVADATKDFTGVTATVKDGVVTLTGEIKKTDLPKLMQAIMASKPKKVENQLVIK
jgi:hyperosmotically inducible periplasmic protein